MGKKVGWKMGKRLDGKWVKKLIARKGLGVIFYKKNVEKT